MIEIGKILRSYWDKNRDAETKTQLFQTEFTQKDDSQTVEEMHIPGVQYVPPVDSRSFSSRISAAFKIVLGIDDNVPKLETLNPGERIAYASSSGAIVCSIWYKDDGTIQIDTDKDLIANVGGKYTFITVDDFTVTVASGKKISLGNGTDELLDILDLLMIQNIKLIDSTILGGSNAVDAPGVASTGTLSLIAAKLATMKTDLTAIQTKLGNIKV